MDIWTHEGNFTVNSSMIINGRFIKDKIPDIVNGNFSWNGNNLTTLEGGPKEVGGDFFGGINKLTSLKGSPDIIGGDFYCNGNRLTNLIGSPKKIGGDFDCSHNQLTSLEGSPEFISYSFATSFNRLTNLIGGPKFVKKIFACTFNSLTSLEGGPICEDIMYGNNSKKLTIESIFLKSLEYHKTIQNINNIRNSETVQNLYYTDLLNYCIDKHIKLDTIESWPENFLSDNIISSVKGISKYNL